MLQGGSGCVYYRRSSRPVRCNNGSRMLCGATATIRAGQPGHRGAAGVRRILRQPRRNAWHHQNRQRNREHSGNGAAQHDISIDASPLQKTPCAHGQPGQSHECARTPNKGHRQPIPPIHAQRLAAVAWNYPWTAHTGMELGARRPGSIPRHFPSFSVPPQIGVNARQSVNKSGAKRQLNAP
jgi:hypothetical protein